MEIESRIAGSQKIVGKGRSDRATLLNGFDSKQPQKQPSKRGQDQSGYMYNASNCWISW